LVKQGFIEGSLRQIDRSGYLKIPQTILEFTGRVSQATTKLRRDAWHRPVKQHWLETQPTNSALLIDTAVAGGSEQDLVRAALAYRVAPRCRE